MIQKRIVETVGLLMIGDGIVAAATPRSHVRLWQDGPRLWRRALAPFAEHPRWTRWLGVAEAVIGFSVARWAQRELR